MLFIRLVNHTRNVSNTPGAIRVRLGISAFPPVRACSLPVAFVERTLGTPLINIHLSNPDNNIHSFGANLRLQNLWDGIEQAAALMLMDARF